MPLHLPFRSKIPALTPRVTALITLFTLATLCSTLWPTTLHAQNPSAQNPQAQNRQAQNRQAQNPQAQNRQAQNRQASAQPPPTSPPAFKWPGEEFYYSVRINGAEAMRAGVRVGDVRMQGNRAYVPISGTAQSTGFFHAIYPLDDRANTFVDPTTFLPIRSEKTFHEKGQTRTYFVDYHQSTYRANVEKTRGKRLLNTVASIPDQTHDMLTWLYELRTAPPLEIGQKFSFYVYDGWLLSRVDFTVRAKEDVYTPMGWFKGWKLDFRREVFNVSRGRPVPPDKGPVPPTLKLRESGKHQGNFWISRDENRLPIKLRINTILGAGEAVLIKYQPAKKKPQ